MNIWVTWYCVLKVLDVRRAWNMFTIMGDDGEVKYRPIIISLSEIKGVTYLHT